MQRLCRVYLHVSRPFSSAGGSASSLQRLIETDGVLSVKQLEDAKHALLHPASYGYDTNLSLRTLKRIFRQSSQLSWLPIAVNTTMHTWKRAAKRNLVGTSTPSDIIDHFLLDPALADCTKSHGNSWYGSVLEVMVHQGPLGESPPVVKQFVERHIQQPNSYIYAIMLKSWANCNMDGAEEEIEKIEAEMKREDIQYTKDIFITLLRFWGSREHQRLHHVDAIWQSLTNSPIQPDALLWTSLALGYARSSDRLAAARWILLNKILFPRHMFQLNQKVSSKAIEVATELLRSYRRYGADGPESSRTLLKPGLTLMKVLTDRRLDRNDALIMAMMELLSKARRFPRVNWLYRRLEDPNEQAMATLLDSLVRSNVPNKGDIATSLFIEILTKKQFDMNVRLGTLVLLALAKTRGSEIAGKALTIHKHLEETTFQRAAPSLLYYNVLLECVGSSEGSEAVERCERILAEIESRGLEPNEVTYALAVGAFLKGNDETRAQVLLRKMDTPNIRTFNTLLSYYANKGSMGAALRVERIVIELHRLSTVEQNMAPTVVTYNIVLNAWAKTEVDFAGNRMMKVYERMHRFRIEPNIVTFNTLIYYLISNQDWKDMRRAQDLLTVLEDHPTLEPSPRHYFILMRAWNQMDVPEFGEEVLKRRIKAYLNGNERIAPISDNFRQVARAYLKSFKLDYASAFLLEMLQTCNEKGLPEKPDFHIFQTVHALWLRRRGPERKNRYERALRKVLTKEFGARDRRRRPFETI